MQQQQRINMENTVNYLQILWERGFIGLWRLTPEGIVFNCHETVTSMPISWFSATGLEDTIYEKSSVDGRSTEYSWEVLIEYGKVSYLTFQDWEVAVLATTFGPLEIYSIHTPSGTGMIQFPDQDLLEFTEEDVPDDAYFQLCASRWEEVYPRISWGEPHISCIIR